MLQDLLLNLSSTVIDIQQQLGPIADVALRFVRLIVIIVIALIIARFARGRVDRASVLSDRDPSAAALLKNLIFAGILLVGIIVALQASFNVQLTGLITALGISGLAFSLALQDVLRNFVAGVYILLEKPFNLGDHIELKGVAGDVMSIELRTTHLRAENGQKVIVPNGALMTEIVTNRSLKDLQPYTVTIRGPRAALSQKLDTLRGLLGANPGISARPRPETRIDNLEEGNLSAKLRFWAHRDSETVTEIVQAIEERLPGVSVTAQAEE